MRDPVDERLLDIEQDGSVTDVTEEYQDVVDYVIELSEHRTNPLPPDHVVVVDEDDGSDTVILKFMKSIDGHMYGFEIGLGSDASVSGETVESEDVTLVADRVSRMIRTLEEQIWDDVVIES